MRHYVIRTKSKCNKIYSRDKGKGNKTHLTVASKHKNRNDRMQWHIKQTTST